MLLWTFVFKFFVDMFSFLWKFLEVELMDHMVTTGASQVVLEVKNLPANAWDVKDMGSSLGREDPLEKGMATHSSIFAWDNPHGQRSLADYSPCGCKESETTEAT